MKNKRIFTIRIIHHYLTIDVHNELQKKINCMNNSYTIYSAELLYVKSECSYRNILIRHWTFLQIY